MRPLHEWDETDLQKLITDQLQESLQLDYKQSDALAKTSPCQTEIAKDVSAFANSAGGRIIYGIVEANNLPVSIDGGVDPATITREWIENTIISKIQPRIPGIVIKPIPLATGGNAYVIDIPQATTFAPHQAGHRYYRRYNFQSVPMEDYEVKDAMRRASSSEPFIYFTIHRFQNADGADRVRLIALIGNRSTEPMLYASMKVFIGKPLFSGEHPKIGSWNFDEGFVQVGNEAHKPPVHIYSSNHGIPGSMPIFKEKEFALFKVELPLPDTGHYYLGYEIACPGYAYAVVGEVFFNGNAFIPLNGEAVALVQPHATLTG